MDKAESRKFYCCNHCGFSVTNRADWCDMGCGRDYNAMIDITKNITEALKQHSEEWKKKYETLNKELMCELRDPCGTIWEHAKVQQDKIQDLERHLQAETKVADGYHRELVELHARLSEAEKIISDYLTAITIQDDVLLQDRAKQFLNRNGGGK